MKHIKTEHIWKQHRVTVDAKHLAKRAWLTASIDVLLDGKLLLKTGGQFRYQGSCVNAFASENGIHAVVLIWGKSFWGVTFPYVLRIDNEDVGKGRVKVENWFLGWPLQLVLWAVILLLLWFR